MRTPTNRASWAGHSMERWVAEFAARHQKPFNIGCHLVGMPVIATGIVSLLFLRRPLRGLLCTAGGLSLTLSGHLSEGSHPAFASSSWYASFGAPLWWARHLLALARSGRLEGPETGGGQGAPRDGGPAARPRA